MISSHRINFRGSIDESNCDQNLEALRALLTAVLRKWPNVAFVTSEELLDIVNRVGVGFFWGGAVVGARSSWERLLAAMGVSVAPCPGPIVARGRSHRAPAMKGTVGVAMIPDSTWVRGC